MLFPNNIMSMKTVGKYSYHEYSQGRYRYEYLPFCPKHSVWIWILHSSPSLTPALAITIPSHSPHSLSCFFFRCVQVTNLLLLKTSIEIDPLLTESIIFHHCVATFEKSQKQCRKEQRKELEEGEKVKKKGRWET